MLFPGQIGRDGGESEVIGRGGGGSGDANEGQGRHTDTPWVWVGGVYTANCRI